MSLFFCAKELQANKHKVMWSDKRLPYDGTPYLLLSTKILDCQHGKDRKKAAKEKRRKEKQVSKLQVKLRG